MTPIDPIVIREKQKAQRQREWRENQAKKALAALLWFSEYAMDAVEGGPRQLRETTLVPTGGLGSSKAPALLVATSTPGVDAASVYVEAAYKEARLSILTRAIEMAQEDLGAAEKSS